MKAMVHSGDISFDRRERLLLVVIFAFEMVALPRLMLREDFKAFWSAGYIANVYGYPAMYDLSVLRRVSKFYLASLPHPFAYLPIFVLPFQGLASLPFDQAYFAWAVLNILITGLGLAWVTWRVSPSAWGRLFLLSFLSFPVFYNLLWAQVNMGLLLAVALFLDLLLQKKSFWAGVALGGLWLKPQTLPLLLMGLGWRRRQGWPVILGWGSVTLLIGGISLWMLGVTGLTNLIHLWGHFAQGMLTNNPGDMMNWRMVMIRLGSFGPLWERIGQVVALGGSLLSLVAAMRLWVFPLETPWAVARSMLGTLAATALVAWHSHVHMEMFLLPPLLYLLAWGKLPKILWQVWLFVPPLLLLGILSLAPLQQKGWLPDWPLFGHGAAWLGGFYFLYNLAVLGWTLRSLKQPAPAPCRRTG